MNLCTLLCTKTLRNATFFNLYRNAGSCRAMYNTDLVPLILIVHILNFCRNQSNRLH